ncbi:MAG TPA: hypothetical protein PLW99_03155, partial [Candidatus Paceibacterota bacterium]|nr:hypothetical protein [Candidatus Paceibacterota bacterium]
CTTASGAAGTCDTNNICQPSVTPAQGGLQPTGTNNAGGLQPTGTNNTNNTANTSVTLINPLGSGMSLSSFMTNILKFVIEIGSIVVVLMLVYVGYLFVVAQGNPSKIEAARGALLWTVVGALILLGAQAIAMGIQATVTALGG